MTENTFDDLIPARNETVHKKHRKEVFWQITFPLILGSLLLLSVCSLTVAAATGQVSVEIWRDISLIWMLVPNLILAIIPLALLAGMTYGVIRLIGVLPGFFYKVQTFFKSVSERLEALSSRIASPIIRIGSLWASLRKIWK